MTRPILAAIALTGTIALSACADDAEDDAATEPQAAATETLPSDAEVADVEPNGTVIEVKMLNRDPDDPVALQVFKPRLIEAEVGDTITFVPTDPTHFSISIPGMIPDGLNGWEGELDEEVSYVIPKEGVYGFKCTPHYAGGMVGLIVVGEGEELTNLETAKEFSHPGLAGREFSAIFEAAGL